jgi:hypothetical protein
MKKYSKEFVTLFSILIGLFFILMLNSISKFMSVPVRYGVMGIYIGITIRVFVIKQRRKKERREFLTQLQERI